MRSEDWLPIESCPKDGSQFLAWIHAEHCGEHEEGGQYCVDASFCDIDWWRTGTNPAPYGFVDHASLNTYEIQYPTHWQPIEPPAPDGDTK